jgi:schlafen family protein
MEYGQIELSDLRELIARRAGVASFGAVAGRIENSVAPLWRAEIVIGAETNAMPERLWTYGECAFVSSTLSLSTVSDLLSEGATQHIYVASIGLEFSLIAHCNFEHKPTRAQHDLPQLPWPSTKYSLSLVQPPQAFQPPGGFLVGPDSPSFAAFSAAYDAFFFDRYVLTGSSNPSLGQLVIRLCDERGRIEAVTISPTHLEVVLGGDELQGASLELMAASDRTFIGSLEQGVAHVSLPNGLPPDAWLWLRTESEWLDYRSLGGYGAYRGEDVRDERPNEPTADVAAMIAQGESFHVEFKSRLPGKSATERRTGLKTIVAFANSGGGTMLYGVDDDGTIRGLEGATPKTVDGFMNQLRALTSPMPMCRPFLHIIDGKTVLILEVDSNAGTIHALAVEAEKHEFYVRRGATTFLAQASELQSVAQRATPQPILGMLGMQ